MKSLTTTLAFAAALSTIVMCSVIPDDTTSSPDNASPHSLPHPLSLLYSRAEADSDQDVHTMATFCKHCSDAYIDCANVSSFFSGITDE